MNVRKKLMWVVGAVAILGIGLPAAVCVRGHWRARGAANSGGDQCCPAPQATADAAAHPSAGQKAPFNEGREVLFKVESLGCPLVGGVGCGHLLAPVIGKINALEGVDETFTNWSGQEIRVVTCCAMERDATAKRVEALLSAQKQKPQRIGEEAELEKRIKAQDWFGAQKVGELTAFEFRTVARQRAGAFALKEKLSDATKEKLLAIVERQWEKHGTLADTLPSDEEGYGNYWNSRLAAFKAAVATEAREILTAEQFENLKTTLAARGK